MPKRKLDIGIPIHDLLVAESQPLPTVFELPMPNGDVSQGHQPAWLLEENERLARLQAEPKVTWLFRKRKRR